MIARQLTDKDMVVRLVRFGMHVLWFEIWEVLWFFLSDWSQAFGLSHADAVLCSVVVAQTAVDTLQELVETNSQKVTCLLPSPFSVLCLSVAASLLLVALHLLRALIVPCRLSDSCTHLQSSFFRFLHLCCIRFAHTDGQRSAGIAERGMQSRATNRFR